MVGIHRLAPVPASLHIGVLLLQESSTFFQVGFDVLESSYWRKASFSIGGAVPLHRSFRTACRLRSRASKLVDPEVYDRDVFSVDYPGRLTSCRSHHMRRPTGLLIIDQGPHVACKQTRTTFVGHWKTEKVVSRSKNYGHQSSSRR